MAEEKKKRLPPPPWPGHDFPVFDAPRKTVIRLRLSSLFKEQPIVSVDEAARLTKLSAEEIEDYARQHPDHVLWFGGPTPAIARAVAPEKPEGDQGAAEKSTPLQSRAKWHAELAAGWLREHPNHPHRIFMERLREAVESHPEKLAEEIVRFNEAVKSAEKLDGGTGAQEIPNLP